MSCANLNQPGLSQVDSLVSTLNQYGKLRAWLQCCSQFRGNCPPGAAGVRVDGIGAVGTAGAAGVGVEGTGAVGTAGAEGVGVTSQLVFDRLMRLCSHFRPCSRPFDQSHRLQQKDPPPTSPSVWM